ncbi:MAG: ABC transporter permease [Saprospiraceae bacterium]
MKMIALAWRNIITKPLNLFLTLVLFGLGVGLITFLLLFNHQLKDKFDRNLADLDLVIGAKGSPLQLILCNMFHIDNPTGNISIKSASPLLRENHPLIAKSVPLSLGDNYKSYRIVGTNHGILDLYHAQIDKGKFWEKDSEVTLGASVALYLNLKLGDTFISSHGFTSDVDMTHDHLPFLVVGIMKPSGTVLDQLILTTTSTIWNVHDHQNDADSDDMHDHDLLSGRDDDHSDHDHDHMHDNSNTDLLSHPDKEITSILIQYKNKASFQALNFGRNINENTDLQAASPALEINRLYSMIGVGTDALKAIALLIGIVSALSIFVTLFRSMKERKYELAVMRVLGGSRQKIFSLILFEGIILAILGFIFGIVLAHVGMEVAAHYLKQDFRYSFTGKIWLIEEWWIFAISLLLGVTAAFIPALQAAKVDINKTLSEKIA